MKQYKVIVEFILDAENMEDVLDKAHLAINSWVIPESVYAQQITEIPKQKTIKDVFKDDCPIKGLKKNGN